MNMTFTGVSARKFLPTKAVWVVAAALFLAVWLPAAGQNAYEKPPRLTPDAALPGVDPTTSEYEIGRDVVNDGLMNHFNIFAGAETYTVEGNELALERLREIHGINQLEQMKSSDSFSEGMKKAGTQTLEGMKTIVTNPVKTVSAIPKGVKRFFGNTYRATQREGESNYEDESYKEVIGFSKAKRQLAGTLGVDAYSSNERLQTLLDEVTWSSYAGGVSLSILTSVVAPGAISAAATISKSSVEVSKMVVSESPENLWTINKQRLLEIGATEAQSEALRANRWYSPRRQTALVSGLYAMRGVKGVAAYLDRADDAASEEEAFFMQRGAEMLGAIHSGKTPLTALHLAGGLPVGEAKDGTVVAAFGIDHLIWSERVEQALEAIRKELPAQTAEKKLTLWLTGTVSKRAIDEMSKRNVWIEQNAVSKLFPS